MRRWPADDERALVSDGARWERRGQAAGGGGEWPPLEAQVCDADPFMVARRAVLGGGEGGIAWLLTQLHGWAGAAVAEEVEHAGAARSVEVREAGMEQGPDRWRDFGIPGQSATWVHPITGP